MKDSNLSWSAETTSWNKPAAILRTGTKVIAKIYLSPNGEVIRIVLPELLNTGQLVCKPGGIIDFKRQP